MTRAVTWAGRLGLLGLALWLLVPDGPQQALFPGRMGLSEIAEGVWTDAPGRAPEFTAMIDRAGTRAAAFHGDAPQPGRMILCTSRPCAKRLGLRSLGLTYGARLVLIGPEGLSETIIGHELSHVALNARMGLADLVRPRFPAWFNEGLAVHLFADARYVPSGDPEWIMAAETFRDWRRMVGPESFREAYGDAGALVAAIEAEHGRAGLMDLTEALARRVPYPDARAALETR